MEFAVKFMPIWFCFLGTFARFMHDAYVWTIFLLLD